MFDLLEKYLMLIPNLYHTSLPVNQLFRDFTERGRNERMKDENGMSYGTTNHSHRHFPLYSSHESEKFSNE